VFHCRAGKDRTGVLVAILLSLLGVNDDDIDTDYMLSNAAYASFCASRGVDVAESIHDAAVMASPPRVVTSLLSTLRERYGSVDAYLAAAGLASDVPYTLRGSLIQTD
ncbi:MAG: tyrosine-protein phosphatase, partial [Nocardioides sp.]